MLLKSERLFNEWAGMGFPTLKNFAEQTGESYAGVKKIASRYKWTEKKDDRLADMEQTFKGDSPSDMETSPLGITDLIENALQDIQTGKIKCRSVADVERLARLKESQSVNEMESLSNIGGLVDALARGMVQAGYTSWDDIPDSRDKEEEQNDTE